MANITGPDGIGNVMMGSPTVFINNQMACRQGDIVLEKPGLAMGPANPIIMGCPTVIIGEVGMGSPVIVTPLELAFAPDPPGSEGQIAVLQSAAETGAPFCEH